MGLDRLPLDHLHPMLTLVPARIAICDPCCWKLPLYEGVRWPYQLICLVASPFCFNKHGKQGRTDWLWLAMCVSDALWRGTISRLSLELPAGIGIGKNYSSSHPACPFRSQLLPWHSRIIFDEHRIWQLMNYILPIVCLAYMVGISLCPVSQSQSQELLLVQG